MSTRRRPILRPFCRRPILRPFCGSAPSGREVCAGCAAGTGESAKRPAIPGDTGRVAARHVASERQAGPFAADPFLGESGVARRHRLEDGAPALACPLASGTQTVDWGPALEGAAEVCCYAIGHHRPDPTRETRAHETRAHSGRPTNATNASTRGSCPPTTARACITGCPASAADRQPRGKAWSAFEPSRLATFGGRADPARDGADQAGADGCPGHSGRCALGSLSLRLCTERPGARPIAPSRQASRQNGPSTRYGPPLDLVCQ